MWKQQVQSLFNNDVGKIDDKHLSLYQSQFKKKKEEQTIEDDVILDESFDPTVTCSKDWSSDKLEGYLNSDPLFIPVLERIIKFQKNPYGGNPFLLCEFRAVDDNIKIWVNASTMYHVSEYKSKILEYIDEHKH